MERVAFFKVEKGNEMQKQARTLMNVKQDIEITRKVFPILKVDDQNSFFIISYCKALSRKQRCQAPRIIFRINK